MAVAQAYLCFFAFIMHLSFTQPEFSSSRWKNGSSFLGRKKRKAYLGCLSVTVKDMKKKGEEKIQQRRVFVLRSFPWTPMSSILFYPIFHFLWQTHIHAQIPSDKLFSSQEHKGHKKAELDFVPQCIPCKMRQWQGAERLQKRHFLGGLWTASEQQWLGQSHWVSNQHEHDNWALTPTQSDRSGIFLLGFCGQIGKPILPWAEPKKMGTICSLN